MKLSYIIPVYNVEKYIKECVDSILAQTFDDFEIILVDDGSPDGCPQICDDYADKFPGIVKVIHKSNGGPAAARNTGLDIACGEYIYFFDSDDYFVEDGISELYEAARASNADILQNSFIRVDESDGSRKHFKSVFTVGRVYDNDAISEKIRVSTTERSTIFAWRNIYKRDFLEKNNIRFDENLRMIEDPPFNTLAFLRAERMIAVDRPIYAYRLRNDSLQRKKYIKDYDLIMEYQWRLKRKYYREYSDNNALFYKDFAEFVLKTNLYILLANIYASDVENKYAMLKRLGNSEMIRTSFKEFDINEFKSKSLDWWTTRFIREKNYPLAHLLCKKVLFK